MKKLLSVLLTLVSLLFALPAFAEEADLKKRLEDLEKEVNSLRTKSDKSGKASAIDISGDYQFRYDYLAGRVADYYRFQDAMAFMMGGPMPPLQTAYSTRNTALLTNRFGLNLKARATEDITVKARLQMYKVWGHQGSDSVTGGNAFFADKNGVFDGNVSHVPEDSILRVDQVYATWTNIGSLPVWFSVGRRPSTGGVPTNLRRNEDRSGSSGTPGILVDYAFDGMTFGVAPDIEALPGAYAKLCYGKGFDSGYNSGLNAVTDVDMLGLNLALYDTEALRVEMQYNRAMNLFAFPEQEAGNTNLGDIDQVGGVVAGKIDNVGPGALNLFASAAMSITRPNDNLYMVDTNGDGVGDMGIAGLMYDGTDKQSRTGTSIYLGTRYDIPSIRTKVGVEYNHGSKYWITFTPAADDMITSKLGTRGDVYEVYTIYELAQSPISRNGKAYFRLGYQYYDFDYTGSNNWLGEPKSVDNLANPNNAQMFPPLAKAQDIYLTFNVEF